MFYVKVVQPNGAEEFFESEFITYLPMGKEDTTEGIVIQREGVDRHYSECDVYVMNNSGQTIERYVV